MSQTDVILGALRRGYELTPMTALEWYGCFRLGARIFEAKALLDPGEAIVTERYRTPRGAVVARYRLVRGPAQLTVF